MAGSEGISSNALAREVGVLSRWLREASTLSDMSKDHRSKPPHRCGADHKFRLVTEAPGLSGESLWREGIHEAQIGERRDRATKALEDTKRKKNRQTPEACRIRDLERELTHKDKALAEAAALLVACSLCSQPELFMRSRLVVGNWLFPTTPCRIVRFPRFTSRCDPGEGSALRSRNAEEATPSRRRRQMTQRSASRPDRIARDRE